MKKTLLLIACVILSVYSYSQSPKEIKEAFQDGEYFLAYEAYVDALGFYKKVYKQDTDNANINYKIGLCYLNIDGQKEKAIPYLEKASQNITGSYKEGSLKEVSAPEDAIFFLASAYHIQNQFDKASRKYTEYLDLLEPEDTVNINFVKQQIKGCANAGKMINNRIYYKAKSLGDKINSDHSDSDAVFSRDGTTMVYTSSQKFYDALFYSKNVNAKWESPFNITPDIKSDGNYYPTDLSSDGNMLLLTMNDKFNSNIYYSRYVDGKWTAATEMDKQINSKYWESHASYATDDNTIFFTSNRPGGYGGLDIYKTVRDPDTKEWSDPVNLGPDINTQFNEETPFLCVTNNSLYFSSQGHEGMGGFDIFHSSINEDGSFGEAVNIGYPINTSDDDLFFVPLQAGNSGYMARADIEGSEGVKNIYLLDIYSDNNPRPVEVKGKISLEDEAPIYAKAVNIRFESDKEGSSQQFFADSPGGDFFSIVKIPGEYKMEISAYDYISDTTSFVIPDNYSLGEIVINIDLKPAKHEAILLKTVYFGFNSSNIGSTETEKLNTVLAVLNDYPDLVLEVGGHTDAIGSDTYNNKLSAKRAKSVVNYLIKEGIDGSRLQVKAFGESKFIARNKNANGSDAPDGRKFNRRVDFRVIESSNKAIQGENAAVPDKLKIEK